MSQMSGYTPPRSNYNHLLISVGVAGGLLFAGLGVLLIAANDNATTNVETSSRSPGNNAANAWHAANDTQNVGEPVLTFDPRDVQKTEIWMRKIVKTYAEEYWHGSSNEIMHKRILAREKAAVEAACTPLIGQEVQWDLKVIAVSETGWTQLENEFGVLHVLLAEPEDHANEDVIIVPLEKAAHLLPGTKATVQGTIASFRIRQADILLTLRNATIL